MKLNLVKIWLQQIVVFVVFFSIHIAKGESREIPNELESIGGAGLAHSNSGVAAISGLGAIGVNPALVGVKKQYLVGGSYNWPAKGRSYYLGSIIDSRTSRLAAGLQYTGFRDEFSANWPNFESDSPVSSRALLGLALAYQKISLGLSFGYQKGYQQKGFGWASIQGFGLGLGFASRLHRNVLMGISGYNLYNKGVEALSPRVWRVGFAYQAAFFHAHLEYRQRQPLAFLENFAPQGVSSDQQENWQISAEKLVVISSSVKLYQLVTLVASYGHSTGSSHRQILSGGVFVENENTSLSYQVSRPYLGQSQLQNRVQLTTSIKI